MIDEWWGKNVECTVDCSVLAKNHENNDPHSWVCAKTCQEAGDICKIALSKPLSIVEQTSIWIRIEEV